MLGEIRDEIREEIRKEFEKEWEKEKRKNPGCDADTWWAERRLGMKIFLGILIGIGVIALIFLFGWIVMLLWNWLMPDIFGLGTINYWQGWGLLVLSCILFKGFPSSSSDDGGKRGDRRRRRELRQLMEEEPEGDDLRNATPVPEGGSVEDAGDSPGDSSD